MTDRTLSLEEKEARFFAIMERLAGICEGERPIDPENRMLFREMRDMTSKLDAARAAGDAEAIEWWLDEVALLGDTILGRLIAAGYVAAEGGAGA